MIPGVSIQNPHAPDLLDRLPPAARDKLERLRDRKAQLSDMMRGQSDRAQEAHQVWQSEVRELARLEDYARSGARYYEPVKDKYAEAGLDELRPSDAPKPPQRLVYSTVHYDNTQRPDAQREKVRRAEAEYRRQTAVRDKIAGRWEAAARLVTAVEKYLSGLSPEQPVRPYAGAAPARGGLSLAAAIEQQRERIETLKAERQAISKAPRTVAEVRDLLRREINALAVSGEPAVERLFHGGANKLADVIGWMSGEARGSTPKGTAVRGSVAVPNVLGLVVWLGKDALLERLDELVFQSAAAANGISAPEKAERLAAIAREMLATERAEEFFLDMAESEGIEIDRRPDADSRAVLGLADEMPDPREVAR